MTNKQIQIDHIKDDAKKYYKWKNMLYRYIILWFLFILIVLQFLLPSLDKNKSEKLNLNQDNWKLEIDFEPSTSKSNFSFLGNIVDSNNPEYDNILTEIISDKLELELLYKKSLSFLPNIKEELNSNGIPTDFQYLSLINRLDNPVWVLPPEVVEIYDLIVDEDIDERLNIKKSTDVTIAYLKELYGEFEDWDIVLVAYIIGLDNMTEILETQNQTEFSKIYLESSAMSSYYKVMAYKYIMENISNYIDTKDIVAYPKENTVTIQPGKVKDLIERTEEEWYSYKEIKKLNPWILGNSLPKVKLDVEIYAE